MGNQWTRRSITLDCAGKATVNRLPIDCMICAIYSKDLTNLHRRHCVRRATNIETWGEIDGEEGSAFMDEPETLHLRFVSGVRSFDSKLAADQLDEIPATRFGVPRC